MKAKVIHTFIDKVSMKDVAKDTEIEVTAERFAEINSTHLGVFVEEIEEEKAEPEVAVEPEHEVEPEPEVAVAPDPEVAVEPEPEVVVEEESEIAVEPEVEPEEKPKKTTRKKAEK